MFNFDEASLKGKEVMDGMLKSYADITKAYQTLATEAADLSKKAYMDGVAHVEALSSVKTPEAALDLNMSYMRTSYEAAVASMTRLGELYVDLARTAYKPFEAPVAKKPAGKPAQAAPVTPVPAQAVNAA
ncbi:phasin family protein [Gellertiella hungarica]|uniref:Phasin domain-containing protein n=1 Tax=Gellertiella hungarica TaxID=1572859 RepID=A0A7W6J525_9HYPH|nr:phasin family protein [Gellertiella hungarica]MBB4064936.1 hypothetical protein [Gellertiella hungarica]